MALRNPIELQLAVSAFRGGGVLEKFPTLKVAFLEGNCAWLPWLLYRLDERAELHGALTDVVGGWETTTSSSPRTIRRSTRTTRTRWRSSWKLQG